MILGIMNVVVIDCLERILLMMMLNMILIDWLRLSRVLMMLCCFSGMWLGSRVRMIDMFVLNLVWVIVLLKMRLL